MMLLGIAFWFFPELITFAMFPNISENEQAINLGIAHSKIMGVGVIFIGMLLFWCQTSSKTTAQRLLFGSSFGFCLMVAGLLEVRFTGQANVPVIIILLFTFMSIYSLFVATRRYQE